MRHEVGPDVRYHAALRVAALPAHPYEAELWTFQATGVASDAILRVVDAYEDTFERELLQAWIIAGATDDDLHTRLGMAYEMLAPYRHLCCNLTVFRDKLELLRWARLYQGSTEGKLLLARALHLDGVEAVAHFCGLPTNLDAAHVNEQVMRETYFRGIGTLRNSTLSSAEAAASHALLKTSTAAAMATQKRGAPNVRDALLKLKNRELTYKINEVVPREEIMN